MGTTRLDKSAARSFVRLAADFSDVAAAAALRYVRLSIDAAATLAARHRRRRRLRRDLHRLNDHMLKDIGIARQDLLQEAHKPIWRE